MEYRGHRIRVMRRAFQRSVKISVKSDGELLLTSGRSVPEKYLRRFLDDSWEWVQQSISRMEEFRKKHPPKSFLAGEKFLFLGEDRKLEFHESGLARWRLEAVDGAIQVFVPKAYWAGRDWSQPQPQLRSLFMRFYELQGRKILTERVQRYSELMGLKPAGLSFRCQKSRWGSCSPTGRVSLNWKLVAAPMNVLDYVVVHELAHLAVPNHSQRFWRLVEQTLPQYKEAKSWLRRNQFDLDFISKVR